MPRQDPVVIGPVRGIGIGVHHGRHQPRDRVQERVLGLNRNPVRRYGR